MDQGLIRLAWASQVRFLGGSSELILIQVNSIFLFVRRVSLSHYRTMTIDGKPCRSVGFIMRVVLQ